MAGCAACDAAEAMRFRPFAGMTRIRFEGFDPPCGSSQPSRMEDTPRNGDSYDRPGRRCPERRDGRAARDGIGGGFPIR